MSTTLTQTTSSIAGERRLFLALFAGSVTVWTVGNGLLPLLPVYASQIGADSSSVGYYLSSAYLALASGTLAAGWLSDKFQRRKQTLLFATLLAVPTTFLIGHVTNLWGLMVATAATTFLIGMGLTLTSTLAGLYAREAERGKIFGLLGLTGALGALLGGLSFGVVVDDFGFQALFTGLAVVMIIWPLTVLFLKDKVVTKGSTSYSARAGQFGFGRIFILFLVANLAVSIIFFEGRLGTSLTMKSLGLSSTAIASTGAVGGATGLLLSPLLGSFSDRSGRKRPLMMCYLAAGAGMIVLAVALNVWEFWVTSALLSILAYAGGGLGSSLVTDMVEPSSLGRGLSFYTATVWIGGVLGFAETGVSIHDLGASATFSLGAIILVAATLLLLPIQTKHKQKMKGLDRANL